LQPEGLAERGALASLSGHGSSQEFVLAQGA